MGHRRWIWCSISTDSSIIILLVQVFEAGTGIWRSKGEEQEVAKNEFIGSLKELEMALGEKAFFGGDSFGFVDIILIGAASWFYAYEKFGEFKIEDHCRTLSAWLKRCMKRESVAKVLPEPEKVYEFVIQLRKMHGIEWIITRTSFCFSSLSHFPFPLIPISFFPLPSVFGFEIVFS